MNEREPQCVHVEHDMATATFVAAWLTDQGIPAKVFNADSLGGFEGLVGVATNLGDQGIEVWVDDVEHADRARQLLAEKEAEIKAAHSQSTGPVEATCNECGTRTTFPPGSQGSVQECPNCQAYVDVPGGDGDWDEAEIESAVENE